MSHVWSEKDIGSFIRLIRKDDSYYCRVRPGSVAKVTHVTSTRVEATLTKVIPEDNRHIGATFVFRFDDIELANQTPTKSYMEMI